MKVEGLITVRTNFGHSETLARFEAAIRANGMSVVARVDHADGALEISVSLDATTLLMFGNCARGRAGEGASAYRTRAAFQGADWQDATGQTCLSYTDFRWLATRYGARRDDVCLFTDMAVMIDGIVRKAGSPP